MAGTDHTQSARLGGPAVILVAPQLPENIGAAARAMLNFGLTDLRLVAPRDGWPNEAARAMASGADSVIDAARAYDSLDEAVAGLHRLYATTARDRHMVKPVLTPVETAADMRRHVAQGADVGLLFGAERSGLDNDHVALADVLVTIPTNPAFGSLNLAQAVLLLGYEWFRSGDATPPETLDLRRTVPATRAEVFAFFEHLEGALDEAGFLFPPEKRPTMVRNLRNMWHRMELTHQDVQTLRGMIVSLRRFRPPE